MKQIKFGSSDSTEVRGKTIKGVRLTCEIQHTTANTAFAAQPVDFSKIPVKAILYRGGRTVNIFADVALPLILDSQYYNAGFNQCLQIGTISYQRLVVAATSIKEKLQITAEILFHDVINLSGDDLLYLECNAQSAALDSNGDATSSYIYLDGIEGVGNAMSIPKLETYALKASISSDQRDFGDNVYSLGFYNSDKSGITTGNQVLDSVSLTSDKLRYNNQYRELLSERNKRFVSVAEADLRHQCFKLTDIGVENMSGQDVRLHGVSVQLTLVSANVNASKNWLVVRKYEVDSETAALAKERYQRHLAENSQQYSG